jgi:hypothetical protein
VGSGKRERKKQTIFRKESLEKDFLTSTYHRAASQYRWLGSGIDGGQILVSVTE